MVDSVRNKQVRNKHLAHGDTFMQITRISDFYKEKIVASVKTITHERKLKLLMTIIRGIDQISDESVILRLEELVNRFVNP